jgi:Cu(I)/Ag(I) efflux system membrane fusion protein
MRFGRVAAWLLVAVLCGAAGVAAGWWAASRMQGGTDDGDGRQADGAGSGQLYTCGMHPQVIQEGPGDCPICHMKLTPLRAEGDEDAAGPVERKVLYWRSPMHAEQVSDRPARDAMGMEMVPVYADADEPATGRTIRIEPGTVQNMGIRTLRVARGPLARTIRTIGRVDYDERTLFFVNTKFEGWIEKLHVDQTGVQVEPGAPLFDVYSPALYAAQEELLAGLRGLERLSETTLPEALEQSRRLVEAARTRLRYFDISDDQIAEIERTGEIRKTLTIRSPARGIVTEKAALDGMFLQPGMRMYAIADLARVWVYVDIYEYQLPWVRVGQVAQMTLPYVYGRDFAGSVTYVYPYLDERTRVVRVRLEFDNPGLALKPGMYATVTLRADLDTRALLIPREAYIDSGTRKVAFVDTGDGRFQPRDIRTGVEAEDGMVEVTFGLDEGDRIVVSGQFLLDAESKLREALAKMRAARTSAPADPPPPGAERPGGPDPAMPPGHSH